MCIDDCSPLLILRFPTLSRYQTSMTFTPEGRFQGFFLSAITLAEPGLKRSLFPAAALKISISSTRFNSHTYIYTRIHVYIYVYMPILSISIYIHI